MKVSVMKALYSIFLSALIFTACSTQDADVVIHNAKVYTVNDGFEVKSAVAIKDGRFIAVGGEEILNQYNAAAELDLKGLPLYPGFIDAHCHFYQLGLAQEQVDLRGSKSVEEIISRIRVYLNENDESNCLGVDWEEVSK